MRAPATLRDAAAPCLAAGEAHGRRGSLVFDIGGTTIRGGRFDMTSRRLASRRTVSSGRVRAAATPAASLVDDLVECLREIGGELFGDVAPAAVVVGFPGPVTTQGVVLAAPTLWPGVELEPFPLRERLGAVWPGVPVSVVNDVAAAGYAYASAGRRDFCIVTVSSGVGHKVFHDGRPLVGVGGRGGEIGHVVVDPAPDAPICECGGRGHLGAIASGRATLARARTVAAVDPSSFSASRVGSRSGGLSTSITAALLAEEYRAGDPWAMRVIEGSARALGWTAALLHGAVGVESFVFVGGFANALGPRFCEQIASWASRSTWNLRVDWSEMVELGLLGDDAGLLGAAMIANGIAWTGANDCAVV